MGPEEVPQSHKRPDSLDISGWFGILDVFELVLAWFDAIRCKCKTKVRNFLVSKDAVFVNPCSIASARILR